MQRRRFGRTNHMSTVAIFGAVALGRVTQAEADKAMQHVIDYGVNHIDVAPSYGEAELRLGPWLEKERERFFLGCKTTERTKEAAAAELRRSLERLRVDNFDLYQFHAVTSMEELDKIFAPGGAMEAVQAARDEGLTKYIGITGHGYNVVRVFQEALNRFDFDSILFPVNFIQYADPTYREDAKKLLAMARQRDVGVMAIKAVAKGQWGDQEHAYHMWYEPFEQPDRIQEAINFTLSQPVTGYCTGGDPTLLPHFLQACADFKAMNEVEQEALIATADQWEPLFTAANVGEF